MEKTPKEMLKAYVDSQKFSNTTEIMDAMKEMFRDVLQQVMESELDTELGYEKSQRMSDSGVENKPRNYRNGYSKKTVKTQLGAVDVKVPRDRNGEYEPQIIGKYSRNADGMEEKILGLYACGMSQRDISEQIKNLYDVDISPELVSKISESMWTRMKCELFYDRIAPGKMTVEQLKTLIWRFFISYWNRRRICSANDGLPPTLKRLRYYAAQGAVA